MNSVPYVWLLIVSRLKQKCDRKAWSLLRIARRPSDASTVRCHVPPVFGGVVKPSVLLVRRMVYHSEISLTR